MYPKCKKIIKITQKRGTKTKRHIIWCRADSFCKLMAKPMFSSLCDLLQLHKIRYLQFSTENIQDTSDQVPKYMIATAIDVVC